MEISREDSPRCRVLLADDLGDFRFLTRLTLERAGVEVLAEEATNAREAVALAATHEPEVIVLDVVMPGMAGTDIIPELERVAPGIKVILFTAFDEYTTNADVFAVVSKANLRSLVPAVSAACGHP